MQVSVETTQGLERRLTISVPAEQIEKVVKDNLLREAKRARIPGFRPGKVPASVIEKRYGAAIRQDVTGEIMQRNFIEAIVAEKLNGIYLHLGKPTSSCFGFSSLFIS